MTDTLVLNPAFGFKELRDDELFSVDGGGSIAQGLWLCAGIVVSAWTPIVTVALAATGVGAPVAVGAAVYGTGAATYCFSRASHA
jgi:hypothetical protein